MREYRPEVGDRVSVTLHGVLVGYEHDLGVWQLRGEADGGHFPWTWDLHWATEFQPEGPPEALSAPESAQEAPEGKSHGCDSLGPQNACEGIDWATVYDDPDL